ncbi:polysaccharide deacetylase family protein [Novisyntrophococcus fermenticellae]|uniref:polysaccharide deacetylase family protein n=1 Tax=Novisyntrophococcus fermenticellae TaxID=2068655 RepID=UPI001E4A92CD|nr:polysaccharide deacetylase [Novisyntrophococcus fermenticellae]
MLIERTVWPQNKKCAAMISVNLDAEFFGKIYYPEINVDEGDILRLGRTSIWFGLPGLLEVLDRYEVKATFFIPGVVAERYPDAVRSIVERGHEIGCHGNNHEILAHLTVEEQRAALTEARDTLTEITGKAPAGFRMPEGEISEETLVLVKELGFAYSSSLSDDDVPYIREGCELMELPIHWELFDLPYFVFTFDPPIPPGQSRSACMDDVLANWMYELEGARRFGTLFNLQLDPQAIGEQGRIFMLERLLEELKNTDDVWIAAGEEIAAYCSK